MGRLRYNKIKEAVSKIKSRYYAFHAASTLPDQELKIYKKEIKTA